MSLSKKLAIVIAAGALAAMCSLCACSGNQSSQSSQPSNSNESAASTASTTSSEDVEIKPITVEEFTDNYFSLASEPDDDEGMIGVALICTSFGADHGVAAADPAELRAVMLEAWNSLDADTQKAFDERFMKAVDMIDAGIADPNSLDISASPILGQLLKASLKDEQAMKDWDVLKANTLTLGNSEG